VQVAGKLNNYKIMKRLQKLNQNTKLTLSVALFIAFCLGGSAHGQTALDFSATFGSNNDGVGGFTHSLPEDIDQTSPTLAESVQYTNTGATSGGTKNTSFLQDFTVDRTNGLSYTLSGQVTWSSYANQNNRIGMYMFGDEQSLTAGSNFQEDEAGAIGLIYNSDNNDIRIGQGIDLAEINSTTLTGTTPFTPNDNNAITNYVVDFETTFTFFDNAGTDSILISFDMTALDNFSSPFTTNVSSTVVAATYTGDYFGFVSRGRDSGPGDFVLDYETFSLIAVPEPSTFTLLALGMAGLFFRRRRS
jgi:hypothetical protein